ncbi:hypothetical protein [Caballeronia sp. LZ035]|nr:hypothetical protein [Caballeronia sp. LZ035]MDR5758206.1 hypothetical protein [Caballeronia sp. LZ035]
MKALVLTIATMFLAVLLSIGLSVVWNWLFPRPLDLSSILDGEAEDSGAV